MFDRSLHGLYTALGLIAIFVMVAHPSWILWGVGGAAILGIVAFIIFNLEDCFGIIFSVLKFLFWPALIGYGIYYFWWRPNHG